MKYLKFFRAIRNSIFKFESVYSLIIIIIVMVLASCSGEISKQNDEIKNEENLSNNNAAKPQPVMENISLPIKNPDNILKIHGSNTIGSSLIPRLASEYLISLGANSVVKLVGEHENESSLQAYVPTIAKVVSIEIHAHGSSTAFKGFRNNSIDIGMSSRPIKKQEKLELLVHHGDLSLPKNETVIGMDGLSIITHPNNNIKQLTTTELAKVFSGEIENWSYFGEADRLISIYARDSKSGTFDTFKALVLKPYKVELNSKTKRFESNVKLSDSVSKDLGAIGFTGMAFVKNNNVLNISASKDFQYIAPTNFTVNTEDYPLSRRLFLYKSQEKNSNHHIEDFLKLVISDKGQKVVEEVGFISQKVYSVSSHIKNLPRKYINATNEFSRLSLNIKLQAENFIFDSKAEKDLDRLADFIKDNNISEIKAIGLSGNISYNKNTINNEELNIKRSLRLAYMVNYGLRTRGIKNTKILGLGTLMPLASDSTLNGIIRNSRVEIWVK